ncbi:MAG: hypothetical protein IT384_05950 [Deltaproteobacteria bacterium]|nr:hypothetical protein [Deltaproteobacteria bacterium]
MDLQLVETTSGADALRRLREAPVDLALIGPDLADLAAAELTGSIKQLTAGAYLPVILLSPAADPSAGLAGLGAGADDVASVPIEREAFRASIRTLLRLRKCELELGDVMTRQAELSRFKEEMSSLLVHDLKNPIATILANLELVLRDESVDRPEVVQALTDAQRSARRLLALAKNLLDVARMEAGRMPLHREDVDLHLVLQELIRPRTLAAGLRGVRFELNVPAGLRLRCDLDLIQRLFENLLDNSLRYTPASGRIQISHVASQDALRVRVGNTGPPIPAQARVLVFEKYAQGVAGVGRMNLGLGLYFCRLASEAHGGRIWVEETPELPTLFTVELPTAD